MQLVHSKVKTCCSTRSDALNTEPAVHDIAAFHGNTAPYDTDTYQTMNLNSEHAVYGTTTFRGKTAPNDMETYQTMNLNTEPAV